jgi:hypothetical protein
MPCYALIALNQKQEMVVGPAVAKISTFNFSLKVVFTINPW